MLILRPIAGADLDALVGLAGQLDSMNLPSDAAFLAERIALSERSFAGKLPDASEAVYVFVLEDSAARRCVGTSTILAKHGRPGRPYFWLAVTTEERSSALLGRRFVHTKLQLQSTEDGPTEIGGIILDPAYRRHPEKCGKALSIVRFAYISRHPERFEREVIAEMLSPFDAPGKNRLWDAFGARFTGLSYREADHLSARSKSFIADLFPRDPVYATLFPAEVQAMIGQPNETAKAALRILEQIGFHALDQVDPFDGGPYVGAARDAIRSVRERRRLVLPSRPFEGEAPAEGPLALVSAEAALGFRATAVRLGADLPVSGGPWTRISVAPRVAACLPAFELVEDGDADYTTLDAFTLVAQNTWNGGVVLGTPLVDWRSVGLETAVTRCWMNDEPAGQGNDQGRERPLRHGETREALARPRGHDRGERFGQRSR